MNVATLIDEAFKIVESYPTSTFLLLSIVSLLYSHFTLHRARRKDELMLRRDTLRRLVGNYYSLSSELVENSPSRVEFFIALNESSIVFSEFPRVICFIRKMKSDIELRRSGNSNNDNFIENYIALIKEMARASKLPFSKLDENLLEAPISMEHELIEYAHETPRSRMNVSP